MRRNTNRILRYFFPAAIVSACLLFLLTEGSSKNATPETNFAKEPSQITNEKVQAKKLKMFSHNPQTQARLSVNADEAIQHSDKVILNNPTGLFDQPDGSSSLKAIQASYYEADKEVHFFEKVNFDHHSGLAATTDHAVLNTKTQDISGNQGIKACHKKNTITANSYEIQTEKNVLCFSGDVCLNVSQKKS